MRGIILARYSFPSSPRRNSLKNKDVPAAALLWFRRGLALYIPYRLFG